MASPAAADWKTITPAALPESAKRRRIKPSRRLAKQRAPVDGPRATPSSFGSLGRTSACRRTTDVLDIVVQREPFQSHGARAEPLLRAHASPRNACGMCRSYLPIRFKDHSSWRWQIPWFRQFCSTLSEVNTNTPIQILSPMPSDRLQKRLVHTPCIVRLANKPTPSIGAKVAHYLRSHSNAVCRCCRNSSCRSAKNSATLPIIIFAKFHGDGTASFALFGHVKDRPPDVVGDHQHALPPPHVCPQRFHWCIERIAHSVSIRLHPTGNRVSFPPCFLLVWGSGKYPVRPVLTAMAKEPPRRCALFNRQKPPHDLWRSASPFVPPRYFYRGTSGKRTLKVKDQPEH